MFRPTLWIRPVESGWRWYHPYLLLAAATIESLFTRPRSGEGAAPPSPPEWDWVNTLDGQLVFQHRITGAETRIPDPRPPSAGRGVRMIAGACPPAYPGRPDMTRSDWY